MDPRLLTRALADSAPGLRRHRQSGDEARRAPGRCRHRIRRCSCAHCPCPSEEGEWSVKTSQLAVHERTLTPRPGTLPGERIDFGRPMLRVFGFRLDVRVLVTAGIVGLLALACGFAGLMLGKFSLTPGEVFQVLFGLAEKNIVNTVVGECRSPRVIAAIVLGAGLGVSGAVFQSLTRNPLGSPDIIGFSTGAYTGGIVTIIVFGTSFISTAAGAIVGGLLTAVVVYLLTWKGGVQGFRLIIVGIALTAMLNAFNTWLILRADLELAM